MKKFLTLIIIAFISVHLISQIPQAFKYQAVVRDTLGNILVNQNVSLRISVIQDSLNGIAVYTETQNISTNQFGLISIRIGNGIVNFGVFDEIKWSKGIFFLQTELDETGGTNYKIIGVSQLSSVPFAMETQDAAHARSLTLTAENGRDYEVTIDENGNMIISKIWICGDTLIDLHDNQKYITVQIGDQCWMAENLNIGTRIDGTNNMANNSIIEKYCIADLETNCDIWGGLYQWSEMMQYDTTIGAQGVCSPGWHLPSDEEWKILEGTVDSLYGVGDPIWDITGDRGVNAGGMLKETGTLHWVFPNVGATNSHSYTALPGGSRNTNGTFPGLLIYGIFWTSSQNNTTAYRRSLSALRADIARDALNKFIGLSVRCIKD